VLSATASADRREDESFETLAIPFPFYNESFGSAGGYVYGRDAWPEPQSRVLGSVLAGTRGSAMLLLAGQDLRTPPWLDRLFIDPFLSLGYFGKIDAYIDGNPTVRAAACGHRVRNLEVPVFEDGLGP
jgi:hypothetical protein